MTTTSKRRCSGTALPGEHEQRRRQRRPASPFESGEVGDGDEDEAVQKRTMRQAIRSWSSVSSCFSTASSMTSVLTPVTVVEPPHNVLPLHLDDDNDPEEDGQRRWQKRVSRGLARAASNGDTVALHQILSDERLQPFIDIDAPDDEQDGTTPLIYGACFGKVDVVRLLLDYGANVDVQDKRGWSALMWATTNNHSEVVKVLLDHGASCTTRSSLGRTVVDFVDTDNEQMVGVLVHRDSVSSDVSVRVEDLLQRRLQQRRRESCMAFSVPSVVPDSDGLDNATASKHHSESDSDNPCEADKPFEPDAFASIKSVHEFAWDRCLPDQMFVFSEEQIHHILDTAITRVVLPMKSRQEIWVPANIVFLSARFAHYYSNRELLHTFLNAATTRVAQVIQANATDIHTLAFWITNLSQLLYYLKKDTGLVVASAEHQLGIAELISETYTLLITDSEKRMAQILEPALLEHDPICGQVTVEFADDWQRFFRRGRSRRSMAQMPPPPSSLPPPSLPSLSANDTSSVAPRTLSPQSITSLLSSVLYVLQSYQVHPSITQQAIAQFFHFMSCDAFNRILTNKKFLCRSKAMQIRMNISSLEEWVRDNKLSNRVASYLQPLVQLVQMLQCLSQMRELLVFLDTIKSFDLLNALQMKRCVLNYRYEVDEPRLPDEIVKYVLQIAKDTVRQRRPSSYCEPRDNNGENGPRRAGARPTSVASLGSLLARKPSNDSWDTELDVDDDSGDQREWTVEKRDTKYMLPFSLPNTSVHNWDASPGSAPTPSTVSSDDQDTCLSDEICQQIKLKKQQDRYHLTKDRGMVPTIPEDWLEQLDTITIT